MRSSCPQLAEPSFPSSRGRETIGHVTYHCCTWQNPLKLFLQFFHPRVVYKAFSKCFMPKSRLDGSFQFGSEAHCSCNEGYYFLGSPVLHCEFSGNDAAWRDEPPRCGKILRQPPQQIPNGAFSNSHKNTFEYHEIVTYSGKSSSGPGEWSLDGESRLICSGPNVWSSEPPQCKVVRCDYLSLAHGNLVSGFGKKKKITAKQRLNLHASRVMTLKAAANLSVKLIVLGCPGGQTVLQVSGLCQQRGASVILTTKKRFKKEMRGR